LVAGGGRAPEVGSLVLWGLLRALRLACSWVCRRRLEGSVICAGRVLLRGCCLGSRRAREREREKGGTESLSLCPSVSEK
jgi:hypothetical protein